MNENLSPKPSSKLETIALARYSAVSWVQTQLAQGQPLRGTLKQAAERAWNGRFFSWATIERYYYDWRRGGFSALYPKSRSDRGKVKNLSSEVRERLVQLRIAHPQLTVVHLVKQLCQEGLLIPGTYGLNSIYRYLEKVGMDPKTLKAAGPRLADGSGPTKAFEFALSNALWMTDMMYGPTLKLKDNTTIGTRLFALLDDCSRLCPHGEYYAIESTECFLDVFRQSIERRGVPDALYTDQGRIFTCRHLQIVCANLGTRLIHAKPYAAWSKGKIERFFLRVQQDFQQGLSLKPASSLSELNERFWQWLESDYHHQPHHGLSGETPSARFTQRSAAIKVAPCSQELSNLFLYRVSRRVRKDATVSLHGKWFEVSPALRGQKVEIHYNPFTFQSVEVYWQGKLFCSAKPLDKHLNARTFTTSGSSYYDGIR